MIEIQKFDIFLRILKIFIIFQRKKLKKLRKKIEKALTPTLSQGEREKMD